MASVLRHRIYLLAGFFASCLFFAALHAHYRPDGVVVTIFQGDSVTTLLTDGKKHATDPSVKMPETGKGPRGKDVVLLMASDNKGNQGQPIHNLRERVIENRQEYADWHGYTFYQVDFDELDFSGPVVWKKILAIQKAFAAHPEAEWIWWLDLDAIIMTPNVALSTYLLHPSVLEKRLLKDVVVKHTPHNGSSVAAEDVNLIIAQDHNGLNAGSLFLRRGAWTRMLLDAWTDPYVIEHHKDKGKEQDALIHFVKEYDEVLNHTGFVDQHIMNAYHVGGEHMKWQEGDICVHFAGCWVANACNEVFEKRWSTRTTVPEKYLKAPRQFP
ncbi:hypothetical protein E4T38_08932 [Aureobasidium subglaciale]|nr:hypothetical protein E4T38_08932 [Aureobasidium subglaciale]KAI5214594.1 hypothetical protein E4T40_08922 [Aureobasidium subglaciale]KAI5217382.1 hypothetical protein E4T41_08881 [Aureobasidium subglaciale]KAI5255042.1 hypothetical protein E4T46_08915 [Aureobasidium subglaciale]